MPRISTLSTSWIQDTYRSNGAHYTGPRTITKKCYFGRWNGRSPNTNNPKVNGWRAPSAADAYEIKAGTTPGDWWTQRGYLNMRYHLQHHGNSYFTNPPPDTSWLLKSVTYATNTGRYLPAVSANTSNRAITQALAKANRNQVEIGVALGEARESVGMVIHRAKSLMRALLLVKRGQFNRLWAEFGAKVRVGTGASLWLEYSFGWKPLISDLNSAVETLSRGLDKRLLVHASSLVRAPLSHPAKGSWYLVTDFEGEESAFCRLDLQVDSTRIQSMKQLGLFNPFSVAWELIPFSFLVDYVVPLGTTIEALGGTFGTTVIGKSLTKRVKHSGSFIPNPPAGSFEGVYWRGERPVTSWQTKAYSRSVKFAAVPRVYFTDPFSTSSRVANMVALAYLLSRG